MCWFSLDSVHRHIHQYKWKDIKKIIDISSPLQERLQPSLLLRLWNCWNLWESAMVADFHSANAVDQYGSMIYYAIYTCWNTLQQAMLWIGTYMIRQSQISTWIHHEFRIPVCWNLCWRFTGYMAADHCAVKFSERHSFLTVQANKPCEKMGVSKKESWLQNPIGFPLKVQHLGWFKNKHRSVRV